jgi:hypothetical protein
MVMSWLGFSVAIAMVVLGAYIAIGVSHCGANWSHANGKLEWPWLYLGIALLLLISATGIVLSEEIVAFPANIWQIATSDADARLFLMTIATLIWMTGWVLLAGYGDRHTGQKVWIGMLTSIGGWIAVLSLQSDLYMPLFAQ